MTSSGAGSSLKPGESIGLAGRALKAWTARHVLVAVVAAVVVAVVMGVATVLIPNPAFARDIAPVWWNYPVWLVTSALAGMLVATYVRARTSDDAVGGSDTDTGVAERHDEVGARRSSRLGVSGGILAWFAVGCPVCNKLALLAFGYSGAITWFAPVQPYLALGALTLTAMALVGRLRGQVACPVPPKPMVAPR